MTDVNKLYIEFSTKIDEICKECRQSVSEADGIEQDLLHFLENESCDAVTMVMIAKKLQKNRRDRRNDKIRLEQIQSIKSTIPILANKKNLTSFENKTYTYRSDVMHSIAHKPKTICRCKHKVEK
jgi:superfamily I DNA and RNA helicase